MHFIYKTVYIFGEIDLKLRCWVIISADNIVNFFFFFFFFSQKIGFDISCKLSL